MASIGSAMEDDRAKDRGYHGSNEHLLSLFHGLSALIFTGTSIAPPSAYSSGGYPVLSYPQIVPRFADESGLARGWSQGTVFPLALLDNSLPSIHLPVTNSAQHCRCVSDEPRLHPTTTPSIPHSLLRRKERGYWLAAKIPWEVLDNIVDYVPDCLEFPPEQSTKGCYILRRCLSSNTQDLLQPLRSCSLVCRRWANICRDNMFSLARLIFYTSTPEELDEFLAYASHGCPSLVPIYKLIGWICLVQRYDATRSFCHRLNALPQDMASNVYKRLDLLGPVPDGFHSSRLSTPHWSLPPTIVMPHSLFHVYGEINAADIHMPSFSHVVRFITHFAHTKSWETFVDSPMGIIDSVGPWLSFHSLTWDNDRDYPPHFRKPVLCRRPYNSRSRANFSDSIFVDHCTNNIRLCMHALIARPTCCMHWMPDAERQWAFSLITSLKDLDDDRWQSESCHTSTGKAADFDVLRLEDFWNQGWRYFVGISVLWFSMNSSGDSAPLRVVLYIHAPPQAATTDMGNHLIGLLFFLPSLADVPINTDALIQRLRRGWESTRRLQIVLCWESGNYINEIQKHSTILNTQTEAHDFFFASRREESVGSAVQIIDPVTRAPGGQSWKDETEIIPSLCNIPRTPDWNEFGDNRYGYPPKRKRGLLS